MPAKPGISKTYKKRLSADERDRDAINALRKRSGLRPIRSGMVNCMGPGKKPHQFESPDIDRVRVCATCKELATWEEGVAELTDGCRQTKKLHPGHQHG